MDKKNYFVAFLIFLSLAIFITYPLVFKIGELVTGFGDELVISWIINWAIYGLLDNPLSIFDANIYFPFSNTYAYSDLHLTSAFLAIPVSFFIKEPAAVFNFTLLFSLVLVPFGVFSLSSYLTKNFFASLLSGLLVMFSPVFLDKKVHIQIISIEWIPFSILFFLLFVKKKKVFYLVLTSLFFLMQSYNNFMAGYFLIFFYCIYVSYVWFSDRTLFKSFFKTKNFLILLFTLIVLVPIIRPYFQVSKEFSYVRDLRDAIHFANQPEDLIYPNEHTRLQSFLISLSDSQKYPIGSSMKPGYLGLVFTILSVITVVYFIKKFKKSDAVFNTIVISGLFGLILSLGPALHLGRVTIHNPFMIPLPYALLYYIAPGFAGFRNSSRWEMMFVVLMPIAIAFFISKILEKRSSLLVMLIYSVLFLVILIEHNFPMRFYPITQKKDFPQIYNWINSNVKKEDELIIMPIYNWDMQGSVKEIKRQYYSTVGFRKMVNGYSGFSPPPWQDMVRSLSSNFPNGKSLKTIKNMGVDYLIIDKISYDEDYAAKKTSVDGLGIVKLLKINTSIRFVTKIDEFYVFSLSE